VEKQPDQTEAEQEKKSDEKEPEPKEEEKEPEEQQPQIKDMTPEQISQGAVEEAISSAVEKSI